jgi:hypothetical protein
MINFRKIIGYIDTNYPSFDTSTPWFEFQSYIETCKSLDVKPSVQRFLAYNRYFKSIGIDK